VRDRELEELPLLLVGAGGHAQTLEQRGQRAPFFRQQQRLDRACDALVDEGLRVLRLEQAVGVRGEPHQHVQRFVALELPANGLELVERGERRAHLEEPHVRRVGHHQRGARLGGAQHLRHGSRSRSGS
jgi:hypothetical protein